MCSRPKVQTPTPPAPPPPPPVAASDYTPEGDTADIRRKKRGTSSLRIKRSDAPGAPTGLAIPE